MHNKAARWHKSMQVIPLDRRQVDLVREEGQIVDHEHMKEL